MLCNFIITCFVLKVRVWQTSVVPIYMWAFFGGRQRQIKNDKNVASFKKSDEFCNLSTSCLKYMFQTHSLYETALNHLSNAIKVEASEFIKTMLKCRNPYTLLLDFKHKNKDQFYLPYWTVSLELSSSSSCLQLQSLLPKISIQRRGWRGQPILHDPLGKVFGRTVALISFSHACKGRWDKRMAWNNAKIELL